MPAYANHQVIPEKSVEVAKPLEKSPELPDTENASLEQITVSEQQLRQDKSLTEYLLNQAIETGNVSLIQYLLPIYCQFSHFDTILVAFAEAQLAKKQQRYDEAIRLYRDILAIRPELTPVRIQLAISLFTIQQDNAAREQFEKALSDQALPQDIALLIQQYQQALKNRNRWQISFSASYLRETNVNNASSDHYIENTPFKKNPSMLPQKANGVNYTLDLTRDFNLSGSHYLHIENNLYGKSYWDNHDFDEITNRLYLGYTYKTEHQRVALLPFYEQQWYSGHRYKRTVGGRAEFNRWLNPNWQLSTALEYGRNFYAENPNLNGTSKLASGTLLWRPTSRYFFYTGIDYAQERTAIRRYGYDLTTVRLGWGQEWLWGISSRISLSASKRQYKDNFSLGSVFHFDKKREDEIYQLNVTAWKRDWHIFGITPKLHYRWKKQRSNFSTLHSYSDKSITFLFEKAF